MKIKKIIILVVGMLQSTIAVVAIAFAFMLYFGFFDLQMLVGESVEYLHFYVMIPLSFAFFSSASGIFLLYEGAKLT